MRRDACWYTYGENRSAQKYWVMSKFLPLFPLQLVVFPGEKLKLHIFEPRYKQLVGECRDEKMTFGLPAFFDGRVAEYGTEMRLLTIFKTYDDGRMDIMTEGVAAFLEKRKASFAVGP